MNRVMAKKDCLLSYGQINKCHVMINKRQIWNVVILPTEEHPFYGLSRYGTTIELPPEDLDRCFDVVWE